jgi:hypothetical protein
MRNLLTFKEFVNESLNEQDMTRSYDGFIIIDGKTKELYKSKYIKGTKNTKVEDIAFRKLVDLTGSPMANFMVHGFIKKGEWKDSTLEEI